MAGRFQLTDKDTVEGLPAGRFRLSNNDRVESEQPTTSGILGRRAIAEAAPTAGFISGVAAAQPLAVPLAAGVGALFPPASPVTVPATELAVSLLGGFGGQAAVSSAQESILKRFPEVAKSLGIDEGQAKKDIEASRTAYILGSALPGAVTGRPWELLSKGGLKAAGVNAAAGAGVSGGLQLATEGKIDPTQLAIDTLLSGTQGSGTNILGRPFQKAGAAVGGRIAPQGAETMQNRKVYDNIVSRAKVASILPGAQAPADEAARLAALGLGEEAAPAQVAEQAPAKSRIQQLIEAKAEAQSADPEVNKSFDKRIKEEEFLIKSEQSIPEIKRAMAIAEANGLNEVSADLSKKLEMIQKKATKIVTDREQLQLSTASKGIEVKEELPVDAAEEIGDIPPVLSDVERPVDSQPVEAAITLETPTQKPARDLTLQKSESAVEPSVEEITLETPLERLNKEFKLDLVEPTSAAPVTKKEFDKAGKLVTDQAKIEQAATAAGVVEPTPQSLDDLVKSLEASKPPVAKELAKAETELNAALPELFKGKEGLGKAKVIGITSLDQLPAAQAERIRADLAKRGLDETSVKGFYDTTSDPRNPVVYAFHERASSSADLYSTALEEVVAHYGMRKAFGGQLTRELGQLAELRKTDITRIGKKYGIDVTTREGKYEAAEELIGELARKNINNGYVQKAISRVKLAFNKAGLKTSMSDADIVEKFLVPARKSLDTDFNPFFPESINDGGFRYALRNDDPAAQLLDEVTNARLAQKFSKDAVVDIMGQGDALSKAGLAATVSKNTLQQFYQGSAKRLQAVIEPKIKRLGEGVRDLVPEAALQRGAFFDTPRDGKKNTGDSLNSVFSDINKLDKPQKVELDKLFTEFNRASLKGDTATQKAVAIRGGDLLQRLLVEAKRAYGQRAKEYESIGLMVRDTNSGSWRPFKAIENYSPLSISDQFKDVLTDPTAPRNRAMFNKLVDDVLVMRLEKNAQATRKQVMDELLEYNRKSLREGKSSVFGNIEYSRTGAMPDYIYDMSIDSLVNYGFRSADRLAQIKMFGQNAAGKKEMFDDILTTQNLPKETRRYVETLKERVYRMADRSDGLRAVDVLNTLATGALLGNPVTSIRNLTGVFNSALVSGPQNTLKGIYQVIRDKSGNTREMERIGVMRNDLARAITDDNWKTSFQQDAIGSAQNMANKFTTGALKWGGQELTEKINRVVSGVAAKNQIADMLKKVSNGVDTAYVRDFKASMKREGVDVDQMLIESRLEAGSPTPQTDKAIVQLVNKSQGSYDVDRLPLWVTSDWGKTFFKFKKFSTQMTQLFEDEVLRPVAVAAKSGKPDDIAYALSKGLMYASVATIGGLTTTKLTQELFGAYSKIPDFQEFKDQLESDKAGTLEKLLVVLNVAHQAVVMSGAAGMFGEGLNTYLIATNPEETTGNVAKVINPTKPPALQPVGVMYDLVNRSLKQGYLTWSDANQLAGRALSGYRAAQRGTLKAVEQIKPLDGTLMGYWADQQEAKEDFGYTKDWTSKFANEQGISDPSSQGAGIKDVFSIPKTNFTPFTGINDAVINSLLAGDIKYARRAIVSARKEMPPEKFAQFTRQLQSYVRSRDPLFIRGSTNSQQDDARFIEWLNGRAGKAAVERVESITDTYRKSAKELMLWEGPRSSPVNRVNTRQARESQKAQTWATNLERN